MSKRTLGQTIRGLRLERNLTIQQLAQLSGISERQISKIELEEQKASTIKLKTLQLLAQALNTRADQLLHFIEYDD